MNADCACRSRRPQAESAQRVGGTGARSAHAPSATAEPLLVEARQASLDDAGRRARGDRLAWLFRHALREGEVSPLLHLVPRLRDAELVWPDGFSLDLHAPPWGSATPALERPAQPSHAARAAQALRSLPVIPAALHELMRTLDDPQASSQQLADELANEPALAARALRLANSSFYGVPRRVSSLHDAALVVGWSNLRGLIVAGGLMDQFVFSPAEQAALRHFWRHALGAALCSRALARRQGQRTEPAFLAGLLHDIGRLAHAAAQGARAPAAGIDGLGPARALADAEAAALSAALAEHWQFPPPIVRALQTRASDAPADEPLAELLHVADAIAHALDLAGDPDDAVPRLRVESWRLIGLDDASFRTLCTEVEAEHQVLCHALRL
jgi:HD-like signal output (HDOD) protein